MADAILLKWKKKFLILLLIDVFCTDGSAVCTAGVTRYTRWTGSLGHESLEEP